MVRGSWWCWWGLSWWRCSCLGSDGVGGLPDGVDGGGDGCCLAGGGDDGGFLVGVVLVEVGVSVVTVMVVGVDVYGVDVVVAVI